MTDALFHVDTSENNVNVTGNINVTSDTHITGATNIIGETNVTDDHARLFQLLPAVGTVGSVAVQTKNPHAGVCCVE